MTSPEVSASELRALVERIEAQQSEKDRIADHMREIYAEAKLRGYSPAVIRKIVSIRKDTAAIQNIVCIRKRDSNELAEMEAVEDIYRAALGM